MTNDVLVFTEIRDGSFKRINAELIAAALEMAGKSGGEVSVAVVGNDVDAAAEEAAAYPVSHVYRAKSPQLEKYATQAYSIALREIIKQVDPTIVLFGATAMGKDLSARVAAATGAALMTDCTEIDFADGVLKATRPVYSGKVYAHVETTKDVIKMASLRPNIFAPATKSGDGADITDVDLAIDDSALRGIVEETVSTSAGRKDVTEAEIIVSGGRSLKSAENFKILEDLADVIGASVGASRAAVDAGYAPHSQQVGQTGKVVNPKLYIACGISGAIQHLVGMRTSKVIVSINKDENAPIFQYSDYGVVGDLFEIVPLLTEEFKGLLS